MKNLLFVNKKKQKNFIHARVGGAVTRLGLSAGRWGKFFCFFLFTKRSLACLLVLTLTLAACGRKGQPNPPGPADQITFPRSYPAR